MKSIASATILALVLSSAHGFAPLSAASSSVTRVSMSSEQDLSVYEERSQKVAAAAEAGKSRWGAAENTKAQMVSATAGMPVMELEAQPVETTATPVPSAGPMTIASTTVAAAAPSKSLISKIPPEEILHPEMTAPLSEVWNKQSIWTGVAAPSKLPTGQQVSAVSDPGWAKAGPLSEAWNKQSSWSRNDAAIAAAPQTLSGGKSLISPVSDPSWSKDITPEGALGTVWNKQTTPDMLGVNAAEYLKPGPGKISSLVPDWGAKPLSVVWNKTGPSL